MAEFVLKGQLKGHNGWVTSIAITRDNPNILVSGSRDKSLIVWNLTPEDPQQFGYPKKSLHGHSHFIQDVAISSDGQFALTGSWDCTLRLWDLVAGVTTRRFIGHEKDVLCVAFSADNRQIVSASRDKTIKLWNTLAECKYTITEDGHTDWVSCVKFSPIASQTTVVSCSHDKKVKVWNLQTCKKVTDLIGHKGYLNTVVVSPDGTICASGGKDGKAMIWDLTEGHNLYNLEAGEEIYDLKFSPNRYWLCAACGDKVKIWDLTKKKPLAELKPEFPDLGKKANLPQCISLCWSHDGLTLFAGYTDHIIRAWSVVVPAS